LYYELETIGWYWATGTYRVDY